MNKETGDSLKQVLNLDAKQWAWVSKLLSISLSSLLLMTFISLQVIGCFYYPYMIS